MALLIYGSQSDMHRLSVYTTASVKSSRIIYATMTKSGFTMYPLLRIHFNLPSRAALALVLGAADMKIWNGLDCCQIAATNSAISP